MTVQELFEILEKETSLFSHKDYSKGAADRHFLPPEKTDAEKIEETPVNIDPLGVRDFKNVERIRGKL